MQLKQRSCQYCKHEFVPDLLKQRVCGLGCAVALAAKKRAKIERANDRQKREALLTHQQLTKKAQTAFNRYIRIRDKDEPCISCGKHHEGQWHAGHYLSTGARPELRFNAHNVNKQCQPCNTHLHGNIAMYRIGLLKKYGPVAVDKLEGPHPPLKMSREDLYQFIVSCNKMAKEHG